MIKYNLKHSQEIRAILTKEFAYVFSVLNNMDARWCRNEIFIQSNYSEETQQAQTACLANQNSKKVLVAQNAG